MRPTNAVVVERNLSIWALFGPLVFATLAIVSSILGIKLKFLNDAALLSTALLAYSVALVLQLGYVLQRGELLIRVAYYPSRLRRPLSCLCHSLARTGQAAIRRDKRGCDLHLSRGDLPAFGVAFLQMISGEILGPSGGQP